MIWFWIIFLLTLNSILNDNRIFFTKNVRQMEDISFAATDDDETVLTQFYSNFFLLPTHSEFGAKVSEMKGKKWSSKIYGEYRFSTGKSVNAKISCEMDSQTPLRFLSEFYGKLGGKKYVNKQSAARFIDGQILLSNKKANIFFVLKHQTFFFRKKRPFFHSCFFGRDKHGLFFVNVE